CGDEFTSLVLIERKPLSCGTAFHCAQRKDCKGWRFVGASCAPARGLDGRSRFAADRKKHVSQAVAKAEWNQEWLRAPLPGREGRFMIMSLHNQSQTHSREIILQSIRSYLAESALREVVTAQADPPQLPATG